MLEIFLDEDQSQLKVVIRAGYGTVKKKMQLRGDSFDR
jgi:hypothetical protein